MALRINNKYSLGRKISGRPQSSAVYLGTHIETGAEVAIKLEPKSKKFTQLSYEYKVYKILINFEPFSGFENIKHIHDKNIINTVFGYIRNFSSNIPTLIYFICTHYYYRPKTQSIGIPSAKWFGKQGDFFAMVMDILGPSLEDLFRFCNRIFSLKTVLLIADQMFARIEYIHNKNFIHRNINSNNFVIGLGRRKMNLIHIIDFGAAKRYIDTKTHKHKPYVLGKKLRRNARYASINTHLGYEQSRRDDLESLAYLLMYFIEGKLPWQGLKADTTHEKWDKIKNKKMNISVEMLCKNVPKEFEIYLEYCRGLKYDEKPDYRFCRKLFTDLFSRQGFVSDTKFDWMNKNE
eukprot:470889_1